MRTINTGIQKARQLFVACRPCYSGYTLTLGAAGGYWALHPDAFTLNIGLSSNAQAFVSVCEVTAGTGKGTDWQFNFNWSTAAGGGGSINLNGSQPPTAKQVTENAIADARTHSPRLYSITDQCAAFNSMWNASYDKNGNQLENNAWLTTKGVLVLPNYNNTTSDCSFDYLPYSEKNGKWYVTFNNQNLKIIGTFHTHPGGEAFDWINGYDNDILKGFGPIFVLSDEHLLYSNGSYQKELTTNKTFLQGGLWGCSIPGF